MRIFLSYASEYRPLAESLATELRQLRHRVFLDRHDLAPGSTYTDQIRRSIELSDLFVFLITPESVTAGRYTLTELQVIQELAPAPGSRVLPVMIAPTPIKDVPDYLRNLTILTPAGDPATDLLNEIAALERRARRGRMLRTGGMAFAGAGALAAAWFGLHLAELQPSGGTTLAAPRFTVSGTSFLHRGDTAVLRVTNERPDVISDYTCQIDDRKIKANIVSIDHDARCEKILIKATSVPFVAASGATLEDVSYDRTPVGVEIMAKHGSVIWRGHWDISFRNFVAKE